MPRPPGTISDMTDSSRTPADATYRSVELAADAPFHYRATNARGGELAVGSGDDADFTPVELLLVALAACGAVDLEHVTGKRAPLVSLRARTEGHKVRDDLGNHLVDLQVTLDARFPDGEEGDRAREVVPRTVQQIQDRLCTVGRTVQLGEPVRYTAGAVDDSGDDAGDDAVQG